MHRLFIDFNYVEPGHRAIDERLHNWGRWSDSPTVYEISPMFRLYQGAAQARSERGAKPLVDESDAKDLQRGVALLPEVRRHIIAWCYIKRNSPTTVCKSQRLDMPMVYFELRAARQRLVDEGY